MGLAGVKRICPRVHRDERGFFRESYRRDLLAIGGIAHEFIQDNHVFSRRGVLRGMHFQRFPGQAKLVSVASGKIFDVAVDMREGSATFGAWIGAYLDGEMGEQLLIPAGFAHGYLVLSDEAHVLYKVSALYDPVEERSFLWSDPEVGIAWPLEGKPLLSPKDLAAPPFREATPR